MAIVVVVAIVVGFVVNAALGWVLLACTYYVGGFVYAVSYAVKNDITPGPEAMLSFIFAWPLQLLYYRMLLESSRCPSCRKGVKRDARVCPHCQHVLKATSPVGPP